MTFAWRRTCPDTHHDFFATHDGREVGRIRRIEGDPQHHQRIWSCTGCHCGHKAEGVRPLTGEVATRDEAIKTLAAAWSRAKS